MIKDRYRLSDKGILTSSDGHGKPFLPINCFDECRYCGTECIYFELDGNTATLKCLEPETKLELEE
jgi:hypothetical protein